MDESVQRRVERLIAHYVEVIDQDRLEEWPELFAETCRYLVTSAESYEEKLPHGVIYADSRAMLRDRVSALRDANIYEAQRYRHVVGPIWVEPAQVRRRRSALTFPRRAHHARRRRHAVRLRRLSRSHRHFR